METNEFYVEICKALDIDLGKPFGYDAPSYEYILEQLKTVRENNILAISNCSLAMSNCNEYSKFVTKLKEQLKDQTEWNKELNEICKTMKSDYEKTHIPLIKSEVDSLFNYLNKEYEDSVEPCDSTVGKLSQIDNMITGIVGDRKKMKNFIRKL